MEILFLGTGSAEGIPAINCNCAHCRRAREKNGKLMREREAILFRLPDYNLLVGIPPEIRALINNYEIERLDGILATSAEYGHIGGVKEFEYWHGNLDFLAEENLFKSVKEEVWTNRLDRIMFHIPYYLGASIYFGPSSIIAFALRKEPRSFGLSIKEGNKRVIYAPDAPPVFTNYARRLMRDCDILILGTPIFKAEQDREHLSVEEAVKLKDEVSARQLVLTSITHNNLPHDELEKWASQHKGVTVAYDGLTIEL